MFEFANKPQSVSRVLDDGFKLYRLSFKSILPLTIWIGAASAFTDFLVRGDMISFRSALIHNPPAPGAFPAMPHLPILPTILITTLSFVFLLATTDGILLYAKTGSTSKSDALFFGIKKIIPLIFALFLYALIVSVGTIFLIIPGVYLLISMGLYITAIVVDRSGPLASLKRSHYLVKGNWWRTASVISIPVIIIAIVTISARFIAGVSHLQGITGDSLHTKLLISSGIQLLIVSILSPLTYSVYLVLYHDLTLRKEGGDLAARLK